VTKKDKGAGEIAKTLIGKTDLVAVYGGDGCVTAVASVLQGEDLPLAIIPGGTANVMAKELGIPLETVEALELLKAGKLKAIDMGRVNGEPFLLRVNLGIMAAMVTEADRKLKENIGQLAYGVTTVQTVAAAEPVNYQLKIDGKKVEVSGVALTVTNSGHMGIGDFALQPGISVTDGKLNVILIRDTDIGSLLRIAGSALLQQESEVLEHWACEKVVITMEKKQTYICDDAERSAKTLRIEVLPKSIRILVPKTKK